MNRNPNNERQRGRVSPPARPVAPPQRQMQGNPRPSKPIGPPPRPQPRPGDPRVQRTQVRRPNPAAGTQMPPRRPVPQAPKKKSGLARVAGIWIFVLAILLTVIIVISYTSGRDKRDADESVPAVATTNMTVAATTTTEEIVSVDYAETDNDTSGFPSGLDMKHGILIDLESNTIVANKGGNDRIYPASMTKIMTLIVAVEHCKDLDETFTMTAEITDPLYLANASVAGFVVDEKVTVRDLIYGLILPSGGDGAMGLAYHIAGSERAFADLMNEKVEELGLKNTHFTNPTGLHDENNYSTCHEIGLILEYAIKDEFMREVLTTYQYTTASTPEHPEGILLTSTLLSRMSGDESEVMFVQGGKTGYTIEARNCLASFATPLVPGMTEDQMKENPTKYILVTAGSEQKFGPVFSAIDIYKHFGSGETDGVTADATEGKDPEVDETSKATSAPKTEKETAKVYTAADPD